MKNQKSSRGPLLLLFLIILISSCGDEKQKPTKDNQPVVEAPKQIIKAAEAKKLFDNYENRRVPLIQRYEDSIIGDGAAFDVTRFVSYDIETMKQYIHFVEQQALDAKVNVKSLRIYFTNYPNDKNFHYPRQNSIMLVPTTTDINGKEAGFYTTSDGEGGRKALTIRSLFPNSKNQNGIGLLGSEQETTHASLAPNFFASRPIFKGNQSLIMNRGQNSPPPKNQSDF